MSVVIDAPSLASMLNNSSFNIKIFDLSRASVHRQIHLPQAKLIQHKDLIEGTLPASGKLPDFKALQLWVDRLGLQPTDYVVAYDDEGGGWASRFLWNIAMLGHENYSLLSGGLHAWLQQGYETHSGQAYSINPSIPQPNPSYAIHWQPHLHINAAQIYAHLNSTATLPIQLWDCRSLQEFTGEQLLAKRGGHIPNAKHLDWSELFDRNNALQLFDRDRVMEKLTAIGLNKSKPLVVYCQTHHRSALAFIVAQWLGFNVAAYDGAWSEWGNQSEYPIEQGFG